MKTNSFNDILAWLNQYNIEYPPKLPQSCPPNYSNLMDWADSQNTPMLREIAHVIIDNINYITFSNFLRQLKSTIADFTRQVDLKNESFALVILESSINKMSMGCSDTWIIALAFMYCDLPLPKYIWDQKEFAYHYTTLDVRNILILDDASYSGNQKVEAILQLKKDIKIYHKALDDFHPVHDRNRIFLGLPFLSAHAINRIKCNGCFFNLMFLNFQVMPNLMSIFNEKQLIYLENLNSLFFFQNITLTYFDHKFPDEYSTFVPIYTGCNLMAGLETFWMHFLGYTHSSKPVKYNVKDYSVKSIDDENTFESLCQKYSPNIEQEGYNIPLIHSPYSKVRTSPRINSFFPYARSEIFIAKQEHFDDLITRCPNWHVEGFKQYCKANSLFQPNKADTTEASENRTLLPFTS